MPNFSDIIGRADVSDAMIPDQLVTEIIKEAPKSSIILSRCKHIPLTSKKAKQPIMQAFPEAYFVDGDTGLRQTTKQTWGNKTITAEEIACIVPIPRSVLDDSDVPLWDEVKPSMCEAAGAVIDAAALFGVGAPASWAEPIVPSAIDAENVVEIGTGDDIAQDVAAMGEMLAKQGYAMNGFGARPGMQWKLVSLRNANGDPIYTQNLSGTAEKGLYGFPLNEVDNGAWNTEAAELIGVDWSKFVVGIRRDMTYDLYKEGVISDANGKVILNLMQSQCYALVLTMRVGFASACPATRLGGKYAAAVLVPAGYVPPAPTEDTDEDDDDENDEQDAGWNENMTKDELVAYATAQGIDLTGCSTKADVIAAIQEYEAANAGE